MISLFAVGVVTGTILSFELGLLWPALMAKFGDVFGFAFTLEGVSFFLEAIFIGIYVYGWNRFLAPRAPPAGIPIAITGLTGSLMVIAVNGWMNHPTGFTHAGRPRHQHASVRRRCSPTRTSGTSSCTCTSPAYMVVGFVVAGVYAWGGCAGAGAATSASRSRSR